MEGDHGEEPEAQEADREGAGGRLEGVEEVSSGRQEGFCVVEEEGWAGAGAGAGAAATGERGGATTSRRALRPVGDADQEALRLLEGTAAGVGGTPFLRAAAAAIFLVIIN